MMAMTAVLSGMLTACSNVDELQQAEERVPISLTGTTRLNAFTTRSAANTELNDNFIESGQTVMVRISEANQQTWTNYIYTAGANGVLTAPATPPYYPMTDTNVDIVAYSPSFAEGTFNIRLDQSTDEGYKASDLLYAKKLNQEKTGSAVPLQFEHKMAKVVITARAGAGVSTIQSITLHRVMPTVTFDQVTGDVSDATGSLSSVIIAKEESADAVTGAALIPAQAIEGNLITIVTNKGTATYSVDSKVFAAGKVYNLTITVSRAAVGATTAVNGWTDTESAVIDMNGNSKQFVVRNDWGWYRFMMIYVEGGPYSTLGGKTVTGTLSDFYIEQTETTIGSWWMMNELQTPEGQLNVAATYPVTMVTWDDAISYVNKLNTYFADQLGGMHFKLPSEAQWEYAARGGKARETYTYAGGNDKSLVMISKDNHNTTMPVGSLMSNSLGLVDMTGNVWEFVQDWYSTISNNANLGKDYVRSSKPNSNSQRLVVGASYREGDNNDSQYLPLGAARFEWSGALQFVGFRVALQ